MNIQWLEQTEADVPEENDWLSAREAARLGGMRFAKRRTDWRLGRWTAKCAMAIYLNRSGDPPALRQIEILPATSGAPEVYIAQQPADFTISLSHRSGVAVCAVAQSSVVLGCDLETIEERSDAFVADYFTREEQALVSGGRSADRPQLLALLWSGKESALKALRTGLRADTRSVSVHLGEHHQEFVDASSMLRSSGPNSWRPLHVRCSDDRTFHGWWKQEGNLLSTVVASPPPAPPTRSRRHIDNSLMPEVTK